MPVTSKNKEAALLFLQYIGQDSVQPGWAVAAPRITNTATYDDPGVVELDAKLGGYYTLLKDQGKLFAGAPPYPFHAAGPQCDDADLLRHPDRRHRSRRRPRPDGGQG